jgi:phage gp29-like protein
MTGTALVPANTAGQPVNTSQIDTGLVWPNGMPIIREVMTEKIAAAALTGVRQAVSWQVTPGLDPCGLATLLMEAIDGDPQAYMQLAEEIEEKDLQYASVLGTRKRQVAQLDITVAAPPGGDPIDKEITAAVQAELVDSGLIQGALFDMLDSVGKGYSGTEIIWDLQGSHWGIASLDYVDPRFFRFDRPTRRVPLLRADNDGGIGLPLPPYKFAWLQVKAKSGIPVRNGLVRPVAWAWMFKNFALKDWVQFCEVFGMPLRVGKFAPGASEADKDALLQAVASLSSDAACIIPSNMEIAFQETGAKGGSGDVHGALTDYLDKQISKIVLGQTSTTDATPGKLGGANEATEVREDIERSDAYAVSVCLNRDVVAPFCFLNYGPRPKYPTIRVGRSEPKNAALMVDTATKLVPFGFKVAQADIRDAVGFSTPGPDDELLTSPGAGAGVPPANATNVPLADLNYDLNTTRRAHLLAYELLAVEERDAIEHVTTAKIADYKTLMGPAVEQILATAKASTGFDDFQKRLRTINPNMTPLATSLASLTFQAFAGGAVGREIEDRPIRSLASADPYGDVEYADPGYQPDRKKRYPVDTEEHIRAAWSYINKTGNQSAYSSDQVDKIKAKIISAWKKKIDPAGPPSA